MVEATIRALDPRVSFKSVHDNFSTLEDQMSAFSSDFDRGRNGYSPDRVDALVWALTELSGPVHTTWIGPFPF